MSNQQVVTVDDREPFIHIKTISNIEYFQNCHSIFIIKDNQINIFEKKLDLALADLKKLLLLEWKNKILKSKI